MRWEINKKPNPQEGDDAWCVKFAVIPRRTADLKRVWLEKYLAHYVYKYSNFFGFYKWMIANRYSQESKEWFNRVLTEEERHKKELIRKSIEELEYE